MRFLLETLVLTAVMAVPYSLLDHGWATLTVGLIGLGVVLWPAIATERSDRNLPRRPIKVILLDMGFFQAVPLMIIGATIAAVTAWLDWAYRIDVVPQSYLRVMWLSSGVVILVPALYLALARPLGESGVANEFLADVRRKGFVHFREFWLTGVALDCAAICFLVFYLLVRAARDLMTVLNDGKVPSLWEAVTTFPFLPLALVASATFLALSRALSRDSLSGGATYQAYISDTVDRCTAAKISNTLAGIAVLCAWGITLLVVLYPLHLTTVFATSTVPGLESLAETVKAVEGWAEEQRERGRTSLQMAQDLDEHGHWHADGAERGLPALFPDLKNVLLREDGSGIGQCSFTVAANASAPALVQDVDWHEEREAQSYWRYCVRAVCPSPAAWAAPASVVLFSNQASQNEHWTRYLFLDLLAKGRAPAPGGNCTADGDLADRFQG